MDFRERPPINRGDPVWESVEQWAQHELRRLRNKREDPDADQRKLDIALGSILAIKRLLQLPDVIHQERIRPALDEEAGFNIPPPQGY